MLNSTTQGRMPMSFLLLCVLIAVFCYSGVNAITEIPLPHIDIFMLCSSDIGYGESLNYKKEMDGYFSDLIPSALDVVIADMDDNDNESDSDEATPKHGVEIIDCPGDNDRKQVRVTGDGMYVEMDDHSPLTEGDIKTLVKVEALKSYFSNVCNELHTFEAIISDAGSKPKTGVEGAITAFLCDAEQNQIVEETMETGAVVGIIISIVFVFAILGCICVFCGFCN